MVLWKGFEERQIQGVDENKVGCSLLNEVKICCEGEF